jgi:hypothetical protein
LKRESTLRRFCINFGRNELKIISDSIKTMMKLVKLL